MNVSLNLSNNTHYCTCAGVYSFGNTTFQDLYHLVANVSFKESSFVSDRSVTKISSFPGYYIYLVSRWGIERFGILFGPIVALDHAHSSGRSRPSDEGVGVRVWEQSTRP